MNPEPALTRAISDAVAAYPRRRIPLNVLRRAGAAVDSSGAISAGWRNRLSNALEYLRDDGQIGFPKHQFDTTGTPKLPLYVERPAPPSPRREAPHRLVWHAELMWAAQLDDQGELGSADRRFLAAINAWLPSRRGLVVPHRERSLEIFDDEKVLEKRLKSPLFTPGRLNLDLLEIRLVFPPVIQSGEGQAAWLIVENFTTYYSLARRATEAGFDGRLIWGSGNGVATRLAALSFEDQRPGQLFYFGDIDAGGIRIAKTGAKAAEEVGLPKLQPARGLYQLLLDHGKARPDEKARDPNQSTLEWAQHWLGDPLGPAVTNCLARRNRIVQEGVGAEILKTTVPQAWFS